MVDAVVDDPASRALVIDQVRRIPGVRGVDVELEDSGILFVDVPSGFDLAVIEALDNVARVRLLGVKRAV